MYTEVFLKQFLYNSFFLLYLQIFPFILSPGKQLYRIEFLHISGYPMAAATLTDTIIGTPCVFVKTSVRSAFTSVFALVKTYLWEGLYRIMKKISRF